MIATTKVVSPFLARCSIVSCLQEESNLYPILHSFCTVDRTLIIQICNKTLIILYHFLDGMATLTSLPPELTREILYYLPIPSLLAFGLTSKMNHAIQSCSLSDLRLGVFHSRLAGERKRLSR